MHAVLARVHSPRRRLVRTLCLLVCIHPAGFVFVVAWALIWPEPGAYLYHVKVRAPLSGRCGWEEGGALLQLPPEVLAENLLMPE